MKQMLAVLAVLALAACGEEAPKPAPAAPPPAPAQSAPQSAGPAPAAAPQATAPDAPKPDPNKELARRVKQALEGEAKIQAAAIDVTADGGKVTLWGTAATEAERKLAASIAGKVDGVSSVDNQMKVVKGS